MAGMEPRKTPPEYFLEIFADTTHVRDVLKGQSITGYSGRYIELNQVV
jgi:hypothetical protein